jgi:hypothetical protein
MTNEDMDDVSELDLIFETNDRLDALIELMIEKKVITEDEYNKKVMEIIEENEGEE